MDDIIDIFVNEAYTEEAKEDMYQAFGLFRVFNYLGPFADMTDMLMMESFVSPEAMQDGITNRVVEAQDYLLDRHGIKVTDEATLAFRNIILRCLFMIQKLESPEPFLRVLESLMTDEEKITTIFEMLSNVPHTTFLHVLEEVRPITIKLLSDFLYAQEDNQTNRARPVNSTVVEYVRLFKEVFGINAGVRVILDSDTIQGEEFALYMPLYNELRAMITDEQTLVELLMFLLIFSSDGVRDPMKVYAEYSVELVPDLTIAARLGNTIGSMFNQLQRHREKASA